MWLDLRKDATAKVAKVNDWLAVYSDLLMLLTQASGVSDLWIAIEKIFDIEQSIGRFYESTLFKILKFFQ